MIKNLQCFKNKNALRTFEPENWPKIRTLSLTSKNSVLINKAGYTATEVACGWAGAIFEVTRPFGQEQ